MSAAAVDTLQPLRAAPASNIPCKLIFQLILLASTIVYTTIGARYLNECTQQNNIPVYLLVFGVLSFIVIVLTCLPCKQDSLGLTCLSYTWKALVFAFTLGWLITGSVWIYSIYPPNYKSTVTAGLYCHKSVYLVAFWTTIAIAIIIVGGCFCLTYLCACTSKDDTPVDTDGIQTMMA